MQVISKKTLGISGAPVFFVQENPNGKLTLKKRRSILCRDKQTKEM